MKYNYNKCPECGYESNRTPSVCPSCGCDLEKYRKELRKAEEAEKLEKENAAKYTAAMELFTKKQYQKAEAAFRAISAYKDSKEYAEKSKRAEYDMLVASFALDEFIKIIYTKEADKLKGNHESELKAYAKSYSVTTLKELCDKFKKFKADYDAIKYIEACNDAIKEYEHAQELLQLDAEAEENLARTQREYERAQKLAKEKKYKEAIKVFQNLGGYERSAEFIEKAKRLLEEENKANYERGKKLLDEEQYHAAIEIFSKLGGYEKSAELLEKANSLKKKRDHEENIAAEELYIKQQKAAKTRSIIIGCIIVAIIIGVIVAICCAVSAFKGAKAAEEYARYSADNIVIAIEDKVASTENSKYSSGYISAFIINITNNSTLGIVEISGTINVYNAEEELLVSAECSFFGHIASKSKKSFTLNIDSKASDNAREFYYADCDDLSATFLFDSIEYEGDETKEYDVDEITILANIKDSDGVSNTEKSYQTAIALFNQQKYSDAMLLFEKLGYYKDSMDYYSQCVSNSNEVKYTEALSLIDREMYAEAFDILNRIIDYKDSRDKIGEVIIAALVKANTLASTGDYSGAYDVLVPLSNDTYGTDERIEKDRTAYSYAKNGDFENAIAYGLKTVVFPYGIESIPDEYFAGNTTLEKVVLPSSVKAIGDKAFSGCKSLVSITISDSITSIGKGAFYECTGLVAVHVNDIAAWCAIAFENQYANPMYYAYDLYHDDKRITKLTIPEGVTSISNNAFRDCTNITEIVFPDSMAKIGSYAFSGCTGLTTVTIPKNVKTLGSYAFNECTSLEEINYNATELNDLTATGLPFCYAGRKAEGITLNIGANVKKIPSYIFYSYNYGSYDTSTTRAPKITTVIFEYGSVCTSIGQNAFSECIDLMSIVLPASLERIENNAFSYCINLSKIIIPSNVTYIGSAFLNCTKLKIYCRTSKTPSGWVSDWNGGRPIMWEYTGD